MIQYETLILSIPEITNDESTNLEKSLDTILQKNKSAKISYDRWGKYKLAQPVNKNAYGVYFLARYEVPQEFRETLLTELDEYFKLKAGNVVMRTMNTVLEAKQGLEYTKPTPLDESPRDVDKFLKDNKMQGFISKDRDNRDRSNTTPAPAAAKEATEAAPVVAKEAAAPAASTKEETVVVEKAVAEDSAE